MNVITTSVKNALFLFKNTVKNALYVKKIYDFVILIYLILLKTMILSFIQVNLSDN